MDDDVLAALAKALAQKPTMGVIQPRDQARGHLLFFRIEMRRRLVL
jgi:hypothetical protein